MKSHLIEVFSRDRNFICPGKIANGLCLERHFCFCMSTSMQRGAIYCAQERLHWLVAMMFHLTAYGSWDSFSVIQISLKHW